jgi:queuine tRNA-ribosyltransferase
MPVGTRAAIKGRDAGRRSRRLGADIILANTYHLHVRPGRRSDRARRAACTRSWAGISRSSPTRAATRSSASRRGASSPKRASSSSRTSTAGPCAVPRGRGGHPGAAWLRRCDDLRRVSQLAVAGGRDRGVDDADAALGAPRPRSILAGRAPVQAPDGHGLDAGQAQFGIVQGGTSEAAPRRQRGRAPWRSGSRPMRSAGSQWRARPRDVRHRRPHGAATARGPAPLPDGDGHARRPRRSVARGDRLCSTACCRPRTPGTGQLFTRRGPLAIKNARYAEDPRPPDPECGCPTCQAHSEGLFTAPCSWPAR